MLLPLCEVLLICRDADCDWAWPAEPLKLE